MIIMIIVPYYHSPVTDENMLVDKRVQKINQNMMDYNI